MTRTITPSAPGSLPARQAVAARQLRHSAGRSTRSTYTRMLRRETRSSRSVVAVSLASVIIAGCLYGGTKLVLELTGRPPLLAPPSDVVRTVSTVNEIAPAILFTFGALVAVTGLVLVLVALLPGRRARHEAASERAAVVVDDEVVTASLTRKAAAAARLDPANVDVSVSRHTATVRITPESGVVPNRFTAAKAIAEAIAYDALRPALEPTVVIERTGKVGS
jgi:hypothetical protein